MNNLVNKERLVKPVKEGQPYDASNVCTGFGVGMSVPWRAAAYALPAIQEAGRQEISPEFYFAERFSTEIGNLPPQQAKQNVQVMKLLISSASELVKNPNVQWLEEQDPFEADRFLFMAMMADQLSKIADEQIMRFAENRDGDDSLLYMAAHALYMWDPLDIEPNKFIVERPIIPNKLLMVGGPAEKIFYRARQALMGKF
ncbi:MAG: hypothetical protein O2840_04835, partial [bacterium]|nr:hypothetical protein [bacterium]